MAFGIGLHRKPSDVPWRLFRGMGTGNRVGIDFVLRRYGYGIEMTALPCFLSLLVAAGGAMMDLWSSQVDNWWTMGALFAGLFLSLLQSGVRGLCFSLLGALLPLVFLGSLFLLRMFGAGDIKLFMALGSYLGPREIMKCMTIAFVLGAIYSLLYLIVTGTICRRIQKLLLYVITCQQKGQILPYRQPKETKEGTFPFALAIFAAVLLWSGGAL